MDKHKQPKSIVIFEHEPVRRIWVEKDEQWYFSVVDAVRILTGSTIPKRYWSDLKKKLKEEGSQVYDKIVQLKFLPPTKKNIKAIKKSIKKQ